LVYEEIRVSLPISEQGALHGAVNCRI
jgi:hypothetical protein